MHEQEYFHKMFIEHLSNGQYFELANPTGWTKKVIAEPTYDNWLEFKSRYDLWSGEVESHHLNPQAYYFKPKIVPYEDYYDVFQDSLSGLNYLRVLHPDSQYKDKWGKGKVKQISMVAADIVKNTVANPTVYIDHIRRIHPGKNLLSAHQVLNRKLEVIVCRLKEQIDWNIPVFIKCKIETLEDLASKFERTPHVFMEPNHLHMYCLHDRWSEYDKNGYVEKPDFDLDRFLDIVRDEIDSNDIMLCENSKGQVVEVPNTTDPDEIQALFRIVHDVGCFR